MRSSVLTLGTFDGVHLAHQAILKKVVTRAGALHAKPVVLAFDMPPRHAGLPLAKAVLLTTLEEKRRHFKRLGIQDIHVLTFDRKTASTLPEDFFQNMIVKRYAAREMVVGPKLAFGKNRSGKLPLLKRLGQKWNVRIHVVPSVGRGTAKVSSRLIRSFLGSGQVEKANRMLGYPYAVEGKVVHGDHRGRRIGFPTANLDVNAGKILPPGVFWVKVAGASRLAMDGLCNIGTRPTFTPGVQKMHVEVYILTTKTRLGRLYGRKLHIEFKRRIRAEKRFSSPSALQKQISRDVTSAERWIRSKRRS